MKVLDKVKMLVAGLAVAALGVAVAAPVPVMARNSNSNMFQFHGSVGQTTNSNTLWDTIKAGVNTVMGIIGIIAVVMIIYGGIQYMTSAGDTSKVTKAKNIIMYGIVGLVIVVLAFAIVNFVIGAVLQ